MSDQSYSIEQILSQWARERPDLDTAPMALIGRLGRVARVLTHEMEATFAKHGLNGASFDLLATLRRSGEPYALTAGQLMERMMITSGTVTNRIDRLETQGLVKRCKDQDDARRAIIALTEAGYAVIERAVEDHLETQARLTGLISDDDFAGLDKMLKTWLMRLPQR